MEGCKDDVSRWRRGYGWYFRNLFSAHEGELIVLQDPWECIYHEDIDEVLFHEQFALNKEQWREALKLKKENTEIRTTQTYFKANHKKKQH